MRILFVCRHNRFRSQVAEAYFKKINKNKKIKVDSAGLIKGNPIDKNVKIIAKKLGFNITGKPKSVTEPLLEKQDMVIIVADDVPKNMFTYKAKKVIVWKIPDISQNNKKGIEKRIKIIMRKVEKLSKQLNKQYKGRK